MPKLINWPLLKNPLNWVIVILMVLIAGFGIDILLKGWRTPSTDQS